MICIIAGNELEAYRYAEAHLLDKEEWFYPGDLSDLMAYSNFHVLVVGTAGLNVPPAYFERLLHLAKSRGRIGREVRNK